MSIKPIGPQGITPAVLLGTLAEDVDKIDDLFVVSFDLDGRPTVYAAGSLARLGLASIVLNDLALDYLKGRETWANHVPG